MRFNNFSTVVVSLRFFAKCKLRERPGEFYKRIKAETVFCKRAYGNMKFQGVHGKRGAIQFRNSCIKDTKNLPFARVKKREIGRKGEERELEEEREREMKSEIKRERGKTRSNARIRNSPRNMYVILKSFRIEAPHRTDTFEDANRARKPS